MGNKKVCDNFRRAGGKHGCPGNLSAGARHAAQHSDSPATFEALSADKCASTKNKTPLRISSAREIRLAGRKKKKPRERAPSKNTLSVAPYLLNLVGRTNSQTLPRNERDRDSTHGRLLHAPSGLTDSIRDGTLSLYVLGYSSS